MSNRNQVKKGDDDDDDEFSDCLTDVNCNAADGLSTYCPENGRLPVKRYPVTSLTVNETLILDRLCRLEETLEKFQHAVGHSLGAIDNDLCRIETRVQYLERGNLYQGKYHKRPSAASSVPESVMTFNCSGTFDNIAGGVMCVATFTSELLFFGTGSGTVEVWRTGHIPQHMLSLVLSTLVPPLDDCSSTGSPSINCQAMSVVTYSRNFGHLFAGLSDGRVCLFKIMASDEVSVAFFQIWPENNFVSSGLMIHRSKSSIKNEKTQRSSGTSATAPVHCLALSNDRCMLAVARDEELTILSVNNQGIRSVTFVHNFINDDNDTDTMDDDIVDHIVTTRRTSSLASRTNYRYEKINALMFDDDSLLLFCGVGYRCISVFMKQCYETHSTWRKSRSLSLPFELSDVSVTSLLMAAGNRLILAGASNGKLYVFQRETIQHYRRGSPASSYEFAYSLLGHTAAISCILALGATYPLCVLTGSLDSTIRVWHWHATDREMVAAQILDRHKHDVRGLAVMGNSVEGLAGCCLFSASLDKSVKIWIPTATLRVSIGGSQCTDCCDSADEDQCDECDS